MTALSQGALSRVGFTQAMALIAPLSARLRSLFSRDRHSVPSNFPPPPIPVSPPFWPVSVQADAWHLLFVQTPLKQSALTVQPWPSGQGPQLPPQSTPVSSPSRCLELQVEVIQRPAASHAPPSHGE